ncbi:hypothetical protein C482_16333 [Natrialba chahannaoensis JCM 10990]|uniref:DUF385 domain-containing protein n=1 Tax=Natrialba chahannaoensis JCM 10990 TaxID=1227492 RepID=M0AE57_9EURY|nr:hypothetical protein C482_16333 [Natrialba chahannaoensis JCM 10990]
MILSLQVVSLLRRIETRVANPLFRSLLRSRFHWIVSDWLALVSYVGRHSGQRYTFPVAYHQLNGAIIAMTPKRETNWWRNFQKSRECRVWLRGKEYTAMGELADDERDSLIAGYVETHGLLGRILGVGTAPAEHPHRPAESNHDIAVVRFVPDHRTP